MTAEASLSPPSPPLPVSAVKVGLDGFPVLRGLIWGAEPALMLLHAPGGDLDDWAGMPRMLAHRTGHGVVALDLPGHGLSDGEASDAGDPLRLAALIHGIATVSSLTSVRAVVAAGATGVAVLQAATDLTLAGGVCLSLPLAEGVARPPRSPGVPKLFLTGSGAKSDLDQLRTLAAAVGGWAVAAAVASSESGAELLAAPGGEQAADLIGRFLRECLLRQRSGR